MEFDLFFAISLLGAGLGMVGVAASSRRKGSSWPTILGNLSPFVGMVGLAFAGFFPAVGIAPLVGLGVFVVSFGYFAHFRRGERLAFTERLALSPGPDGVEDPVEEGIREAMLSDLQAEHRSLKWKLAGAALLPLVIGVIMGVLTGELLMGGITGGVVSLLMGAYMGYSHFPALNAGGPPALDTPPRHEQVAQPGPPISALGEDPPIRELTDRTSNDDGGGGR